LVPSCARDADCKRLAGEQFGENHPKESDNVQIRALMNEQEHVEHEPQPLVNAGKSLYCVRDEHGYYLSCKDCNSGEPTKNIYVYPIANYYKNVFDELDG
jgi:hypothetical protein